MYVHRGALMKAFESDVAAASYTRSGPTVSADVLTRHRFQTYLNHYRSSGILSMTGLSLNELNAWSYQSTLSGCFANTFDTRIDRSTSAPMCAMTPTAHRERGALLDHS